MNIKPNQKAKKIKKYTLLLKFAVTIVCLWYVLGKIDFQIAKSALKSAEWLFLLLALISFFVSKIISAFRLSIYFDNIHISISLFNNIRLYWLGMFYNLFLPGSIGGDAYKVILLTKEFNVSYKKTTAAVLLDRISGLLGLGLVLSVFSFFVLNNVLYKFINTTSAVIAVIVFYLIIKKYFKDFISSFWLTLFLGVLVQLFQVVSIYFILAALHIPVHETGYIFIFLISSIVSVLPLTIGGIGIREVVFLEGSAYFGLLQETSIVVSLLFYLITLLTSATGLFYVFNDPLKQKTMDSNLSP
ncbi:MAG: lysylphosphatidylglycerol synthase transmembrane domain-containing protein [Chitinophagaceae bacterium]